MFNRKAKIVKKWRENPLPEIPIRTSEQLKVSENFHDLIIKALDKDIRESGIAADSPEGIELLNIRAGFVQHFEDIRRRFEAGQ
jgi:hypothetical protein